MKEINRLPAVITSFAYRSEYFPELDSMLVTVKEHHPSWSIVAGKGPVAGFDLPTIEVDSPSGKYYWSLPVLLGLGNYENDWRKITMMKGWWMAQVWQNLKQICAFHDHQPNRVIWLDADARLNAPLDIVLAPENEVIAGPWCYNDYQKPGYEHICSGMLLFQGSQQGRVSHILNEWSEACLVRIQNLPPATVPWGDGDQEVLTEILENFPDSNSQYTLIKLDEERYGSCPISQRKFMRKSLIDHWDMGTHMKTPPEQRDRNWPPSEEYRRTAAVGTPVPGSNVSELPATPKTDESSRGETAWISKTDTLAAGSRESSEED